MSKHENASVFRHKIVRARARFCKQYKQPNRICFHSERNYYNYLLYVHEIAAIIFLFFLFISTLLSLSNSFAWISWQQLQVMRRDSQIMLKMRSKQSKLHFFPKHGIELILIESNASHKYSYITKYILTDITIGNIDNE